MSSGRRLSAVAIVAFFVAWELVCRGGWVNSVLLSAPSEIVVVASKLGAQPMLWADLGATLRAFAGALAIALTAGAALGGLIGYSRAAYHLLNPFVVAINALPKVVLMPLIVLWVGMGTPASVFLGAIMASFPILTATFTGVRALERDYVRLAHAFGARPGVVLRTIVVPGVLPYLLSGLRVGINYAMVGVLIAEFFGASVGVGYRMMLLMANFEVAAFFVYLLVVATTTLLVTAALQTVETRLLHWRPEAFAATRGL